MKKIFLTLVIINIIFILFLRESELKDFRKLKVTAFKIREAFLNKSSSKQKFSDKKRFFKKSITNNKVIINEINKSKFSEIMYDQFVNESDTNFILNIFDGDSN